MRETALAVDSKLHLTRCKNIISFCSFSTSDDLTSVTKNLSRLVNSYVDLFPTT